MLKTNLNIVTPYIASASDLPVSIWVGSSSFITHADGSAEQFLQYAPFGELTVSQRNSSFDSRYKFSGKELDDATGYNYFGARYYDSDLSMWLSVDPMADARSWVSPYSYVQNSPVMRVDPSGALDDEWELNKKTGEVKWVKESKKHQLFAVDENGTRTGESVTVRNRDVLDQFSTKGDLDRKDVDGNSVSKGHTTGSIDDVYKVFEFCSDNSNVEWASARYENDKYAVWTSHDEGNALTQSVKNPSQIGLNNVNAYLHSHPNETLGSEMSSMGLGKRGGYNPRSDWGHKIEGYRPYHMYVYFPDSKNIYNITKPRINKIGTIKNYRSFYFGVLNHR